MTTDCENWGPFHRHFASDVIYRDEDCLHDKYPRRVYVFDPDYLDEHDEAIRADEQEKYKAWGPTVLSTPDQTPVLADLRARVGETLPIMAHVHESGCPGRPGVRGICTCDQIPLVSVDSVLALIDEAQR